MSIICCFAYIFLLHNKEELLKTKKKYPINIQNIEKIHSDGYAYFEEQKDVNFSTHT